jgi:hypothetical protein
MRSQQVSHLQKNVFRPSLVAGLAGLAAAISTVPTARGQSAWSSAVSDSWFNPARWTPSGIPNSSSTNVTLGLSGAYTVSMQSNSASCGAFSLTDPSASLSLIDNAALYVNGAITNSGLIQISTPGSPGNGTHLDVAAPLSISGNGILRLAAAGSAGDSDAAYLYNNGVATNSLTSGPGSTIAGYGRVYVNLINNGTVNADVNGRGLFMISQPKTNNATLTASNGGFVQFRSIGLTQGASGACTSSNGSPIEFVNSSVSGGALNGAGTSSGIQYYGANSADGVTMSNLNAITDNSNLHLGADGAVNNGTITISDPAAPGNGTHLDADAPNVPLTGTGTVRLAASGTAGDSDAAYLYNNGNAANTLVNGPGHTIAGYGHARVGFTNNGTVNADVNGKGLFLIDQAKVNNNLMTATNGGFLQIRSISVTGSPTSQIASADAASPVQLVNANVSGGSFTTPGSGMFQYYGLDTLSTLTVNGTHLVTDNSSVHLATDLVNDGAWAVSNPAAPGNGTHIDADAPVLISGTGSIVLQGVQGGNGDNDSAYIYNNGIAANTLTLGANQMISGYGRVYANVINNGLISANNSPNASGPSSKGLFLISQSKTNNATIDSSNGGFWYVRGITLTNNGLLSSSNTTTPGGGFESCTVNGGTITNVSGQAFGSLGNVSLNGNTISAGSALQINDNSAIYTTGLTNNGTILVSTPTAPGNGTHLDAAAPTTISGNGTIRLQAITSNGDSDAAYLYNNGNAANTLTNSASHSIRGYGRIYAGVINNGLVNADISGKGLFLISQPKTNNSTITSSNGGFWYLRGTSIANGPAGVLSSSNTATSGGAIESASISGGTLTNVSNQSFGIVGSSTLDGVTVSSGSALQIIDNSTLNIGASGMVNNGTLLVESAGAPGNATRVVAGSSATVSGTGTVRLQAIAFSNDSAYLWGEGDVLHPLTLGPGQTLTGAGRLYGNVVSQGRISPDQPFGTPTALGNFQALGGTLTMAQTSNFDVQVGSSAAYDSITGNDTINQAGALTVTTTGGYAPLAHDIYTIVSGGSVTGTFSPVSLPPTGPWGPAHVVYTPTATQVVVCYANCDGSTIGPVLNVLDFSCFLNAFAAGDPYANCDASTTPPVLNVLDFACFLNKFAAGCP